MAHLTTYLKTHSRTALCEALATATLKTNAARFGVDSKTLWRWRQRLGVPAYKHHQAYRDTLTLLHQAPNGLSCSAIAYRRDVSRQAAHQVLQALHAEGHVEKRVDGRVVRWHAA